VTRTALLAVLCGALAITALFGQEKGSPATQKPAEEVQVPDDSQMPEDDESVKPETFPLNPLESDRNVRVGNYYWHKGNYRAALQRYERATKYNPSSPEAFYKVGEAEEKLKNKDAARAAFRRVIQVAPDSKMAHDAKKKLGQKT
jgi:tetratricopeptide (TPR) repeat protein